MSKTIAIDFDGVIHDYKEGWKDGSIYGNPVKGVFDSISALLDKGYNVFIFSTRNPNQIYKWLDKLDEVLDAWGNPMPFVNLPFRFEVIPWWKFWLKFWNKKNRNGRGIVGITNKKLPANIYIDDRGVSFNGDWSSTLADIENFKTWQGCE